MLAPTMLQLRRAESTGSGTSVPAPGFGLFQNSAQKDEAWDSLSGVALNFNRNYVLLTVTNCTEESEEPRPLLKRSNAFLLEDGELWPRRSDGGKTSASVMDEITSSDRVAISHLSTAD